MRFEQSGEWLLFAMALAFARHGVIDKATRLLGHVDAVRAYEGLVLWPCLARPRNEMLEIIRCAFGGQRAAELMAEGAAMGADQAAALAFDLD